MSFAARRADHDPFEQRVAGHLQARGFYVTSTAYHDTLPAAMQQLLKSRNTPTAELVRNGADIVAVHRTLPLEMLAEVKTHQSARYHDLTFEARQFVQRLEEAKWHVLCLLCYWDPGVGREAGFWMHQCPPVREVRIPARWCDDNAERWQLRFAKAMPGVPILRTPNTSGGSHTPFVVIDESDLRDLPTWAEQIDDLVQQAALCGVDAL
jgi:hypothetical protein